MLDSYIECDEHANRALRDLADMLEDNKTLTNCENLVIILARRLAKVEKQLRKHDNEIAGLWECHNDNE